jgi:hypothetical protein
MQVLKTTNPFDGPGANTFASILLLRDYFLLFSAAP